MGSPLGKPVKEKLRALAERSVPWRVAPRGTWSSRRINQLRGHLNGEISYLEIGVFRGSTFLEIDSPKKVGVDPLPRIPRRYLPEGSEVFRVTSDSFFENLDPSTRFDLVFLDGLHTGVQTFRDFYHSLRHSSPGSVMLIDDVLPDDDISAIPDEEEWMRYCVDNGIDGFRWHGSCWQALIAISLVFPELDIQLISAGGQDYMPTESDNAQAVVWNLSGLLAKSERLQEGLELISTFEGKKFSDVRNEFPTLFTPLNESQFFSSWETRWRTG